MKFLLLLIVAFTYLNAVRIPLPSSSPVNVFEHDKENRGIGYYQFNVEIDEADEGYTPEIPMGTVKYEAKGLIYLWPVFETYNFLGLEIKHFESALSAGVINASLKKSANPSNELDKNGFFIGYHPAFSSNIYKSDVIQLSAAASMPIYFYNISGSWKVVQGAINDGTYQDDAYGFAFKPTATAQGTVYILDSLAVTAYVGFNYFLSAGINYYSGGNWEEEDAELESSTSGPKLLYGWDLSFQSIFSDNDSISLSSAFTQTDNSNNENLAEYRLLYMFHF